MEDMFDFVRSVSETEECCDTCSDPCILWFFTCQFHEKHEICRVPCCAERTTSRNHFIYRTIVDAFFGRDSLGEWDEVHHREIGVEFLRLWLLQDMLTIIPARAFQVQSINIAAIVRFFANVRVLHRVDHHEIEGELIDGDLMLTRVVLRCAGDERLREEETGNPECFRRSLLDPIR